MVGMSLTTCLKTEMEELDTLEEHTTSSQNLFAIGSFWEELNLLERGKRNSN